METSQDRLSQLLASRKDQVPSDVYFRAILPELHRRLRVEVMKRPSLGEVVWERFQQTFLGEFSTTLRVAGACAAVVLAVTLTFFHTTSQPESRLLTLTEQLPDSQGARFSLVEAGDMSLTTKSDQQLDQMSLVNGDKGTPSGLLTADAPAHYVLTKQPSAYDKVAAF